MKRYQTIIVAAALDDRDAIALEHAAYFARAANARAVHVVHVVRPPEFSDELQKEFAQYARPLDEVQRRLEALVQSLPDLFPPATQIHCAALEGETVTELIRLAAQQSADLMCTSRWSTSARDALSRAAVALVRKSPCSVLISMGIKKPAFQRILVPVDFSKHSREALDVACAIAQVTPESRVTVQHGYRVPADYLIGGLTYEETAARLKADAQWKWEKFSALVDFRGADCTMRYDLADDLPTAILAAADEIDAGLIVLGARGLTRGAGILLGHVSDVVCTKSERSVLAVKRKGEVVALLRALLQLFEIEPT